MDDRYLMKLARMHGYEYMRNDGLLRFRSRSGRGGLLDEESFIAAINTKVSRSELLRLVKNEKQLISGYRRRDDKRLSKHKRGRVIGSR